MKADKKPASPKQAAPAARKGPLEAPAAKKRAAPVKPPAKTAVKAGASVKAAAPVVAKKAAKPGAPAPAATAKKPAKATAAPPAVTPAAAQKPAPAPTSTAAPASGKNYSLPSVKAAASTQPPVATAAALTPSPVPQGLDPATLIGRVQGEVAVPPPSDAPHADGAGRAPAQPTLDEATRRHHIAIEAYLIAESRGFPPHCEHEHWLEAERKLFGEK